MRTLAVTLLVASALYGLKESGAFDRAGLLGACETVPTAAATEGEWLACRGGRLSGAPDLSRDSCRKGATRGEVTYWYCPEKLVADGRGAGAAP